MKMVDLAESANREQVRLYWIENACSSQPEASLFMSAQSCFQSDDESQNFMAVKPLDAQYQFFYSVRLILDIGATCKDVTIQHKHILVYSQGSSVSCSIVLVHTLCIHRAQRRLLVDANCTATWYTRKPARFQTALVS